MKKLKDILLEGYAWERRPGRPLPTLAEVQAEYLRNEAANDVKAKVAKLEKEIADLKHQYYSDKNLTAEKSQKIKQELGDLGRRLKRAKREDRTGSAGYKNSKPERWQDNDGDGKWYEPGVDVKENVNEGASFQERFAEYSDDALRDMIVTLRRFDGTSDDIRELEQEIKRRKQDKGHDKSTHSLKEEDDTCPVCGNSPCTCDEETDSADIDALNMPSLDEYGDDETHQMDANRPKNPESDVREKDINEAFWRRVKGNLYGHEYILREAFQSFKKNLAENVFQGEPVEPEDDTITVYQNKFDMVNAKVDGQMRQLLWMDKGQNLQQTLDLARDEEAYIPTMHELDSLHSLIRPGETVGNIWVDQGTDAPNNMRYILFNLSDFSDVFVNVNIPRDTLSQHVVLLRSTPMKHPITVLPKS